MPKLTRKSPKTKTKIKTVIKRVMVKEKKESKKIPYKIEIFSDKSKKPRWRLVSTNGNILATSEAYARKNTRTKIAENLASGLGLSGVEESDRVDLS